MVMDVPFEFSFHMFASVPRPFPCYTQEQYVTYVAWTTNFKEKHACQSSSYEDMHSTSNYDEDKAIKEHICSNFLLAF